MDSLIRFPQRIFTADLPKKKEFVEDLAKKWWIVDLAFIVTGEISDSGDTCYNYARVLCHYGRNLEMHGLKEMERG